MTKSSLSLGNAHIIPTNPSDLSWFDANVMGRYASANNPSNTIKLKVDVHQLFDRKPRFAVVPKYGKMVAHFFNADDVTEAIQLYHNVPLQPLNGKEIRFLLARMAGTVFPHLDLFMKARVRRKLVRLVNQQQVTQETDGDTCDQISRGARSRSVSPRKRPAGQMRAEGPEDFDDINDQYYEQERNSESQMRGRKRRRSSYSHLVRRDDSCTPSGQELHRSGSELSESTEAAILDDLQE
jgi:HNH endonuclease